jgi:hypothetical protein
MLIIYTLGYKPVFLVKSSAILDGLLLTPLQAIWVFAGLYYVQPKLFNSEVANIIKPGRAIGAGLILAFIVFTYFCVYQIPKIL